MKKEGLELKFRLEIPKGMILINQSELREVLKEMLYEVISEKDCHEILTINDAAQYLKVSVPTVRNMIAKNELPYFQSGQVIRINRRDLQEWMRIKSQYKIGDLEYEK